jgi:hypothetical protein
MTRAAGSDFGTDLVGHLLQGGRGGGEGLVPAAIIGDFLQNERRDDILLIRTALTQFVDGLLSERCHHRETPEAGP